MPFDPNKPFTANKPAFDPNKPFTAGEGGTSTADNLLGKAKSFAEGAGQGMTLGNVGNIGGAAQSLASFLGKPGQVDRDLESQGFKINQPSAFDVGKKATNAELDKSYQENPWTYRAGYLGGSAPIAAPGRALYDAAGGGYKGAAALGATQGGLSDVDFNDPTKQIVKAGLGAGTGLVTQAAGQVVNKGLDFLKKGSAKAARMSTGQADAYVSNPSQVMDMASTIDNPAGDPAKMVDIQRDAASAMNKSRGILKAQGLGNAAKVSGLLEGKSGTINPNDYLDYPEASKLLSKYQQTIPGNPGEQLMEDGIMKTVGATPDRTFYPDSVNMPANEINTLRGTVQDASKFRPGTGTPTQPFTAGDPEAAKKAFELKTMIANMDPSIPKLKADMSEGMSLQNGLRAGLRNPIAFAKSQSDDNVARMANMEQKGAGGLLDWGNKYRAAKAIQAADTGSGIMSSPVRAMGRYGLNAYGLMKPAAQEMGDFPYATQQLPLSVLLSADSQKKK